MPTSFTVFYLGQLADIDTVEGNNDAENAAALVGSTFGGTGNALLNFAQTMSPGSTGFTGGTPNAYDMDNAPSETFSIDGGPDQTFDGTAIYNATITYIDGTTATITAVLFQDTNGNAYLAPEFSPNTDQTALEAAPIRSITLDSLNRATNLSGLAGDRQSWNFLTCYCLGTRILTPSGDVPIEQLTVGDQVTTRDRGAQPIRWIGTATVRAEGKLAPIRIAAGALGIGLPIRDLYVSRQHRMLLVSKIAERMFGSSEILVPAIKLVGVRGIEIDTRPREVSYCHLLLDTHEVIYAEGAPSESLLTGPGTLAALEREMVEELRAILPEALEKAGISARPIVQNRRLRTLIRRSESNAQALVTA